MNKIPVSPDKNIQLLSARVQELRRALQHNTPYELADRTAARYSELGNDKGIFELNLWESSIVVNYPEMDIIDSNTRQELPIAFQALVLYYFYTADGAHLSGQWISFSDLQDGRFYSKAFHGYTGSQLAKTFGEDLTAFMQAAQVAGGAPRGIGDAGFEFHLLPRVRLLAVAWQGDEDFASSYQVLFSDSVNHFLPTDACAIAGSMLTGKIIRASQAH